jgi:hypothetical protein
VPHNTVRGALLFEFVVDPGFTVVEQHAPMRADMKNKPEILLVRRRGGRQRAGRMEIPVLVPVNETRRDHAHLCARANHE